ncbi:phthalate transporter [Melanomma pulvis-pyrius CBS 109.77]|uniref:Phthalate transporter n=1 Tax=Melanomma pulvis-pyrius CBS 109.77 TaxID=1314802 RepID=A0A6A6XEC4_9PLEO|nr:phthalate transporter [Melanomma pulvis-pyrius CBS 109.77]
MATVTISGNSGSATPSSITSSTDYGAISPGGALEKDQTRVIVSEDAPQLGAANDERRFWFQRAKAYDPDAIATLPSVYDNPDSAKRYLPRPDWENLHRFNPLARWTWGEEHKLIRKIDVRIMIFACVMFMALELDRANIQQANTDNFLKDLHLTTNDYNLGNTVFKLSFLCAELPSQLVSKWMGPDRWIPMQMILWSVVASSQYWLNGRTSFLACRSLLGILQGGFIPDIILYLSYFYKHHELSLRLGFFWTAMSIADILAGFLAYGLLHMRGVAGQAGWRWLFMIEGLFTLLVGVSAIFLMPPGPCQTASWARGKKGWFSPKEEEIIVNRVLRDDPTKGSMHNRQPVTPKLLFQSLMDYDLWPLYIIGLLFQIPMNPPLQYLTLSLRGLGFDTFQANLLAIPWTVLHIILMLGLAYSAEIYKELTFHSLTGQIWVIPFLVYLSVTDIAHANKWVVWGVITLLLSYPSAHPIQVGWNSRNSNAVRSRTVSAAAYNMFVQAGGVVSSNIYRKDDAPNYPRGNRALLGIAVGNIGLYLLTKAYYVWRNKSRDSKWNAMTQQQQLEYLETTTDEGNKRLDFRFAH